MTTGGISFGAIDSDDGGGVVSLAGDGSGTSTSGFRESDTSFFGDFIAPDADRGEDPEDESRAPVTEDFKDFCPEEVVGR